MATVILTPNDEFDILRRYAVHANYFVTPHADFSKFTAAVKTIRDFRFGIVSLANNVAL